MANARTRQDRLTFGLAFIALCATLIVGRVGYRYRDLMIERENRRREAVRARREIDSLLEATGDGVLGIDLEGKCTSLNRVGAQLLGYAEREIVGRDVHDTLCHSLPDGSPNPRGGSPVLKALVAGEALDSADGDVLWRRKRISFPVRWSLRPLVDGIALRGAVLTFTDMTEIHEKEEALRRAIRQREDVVSIVSHDLRNPLGVALAAADLLLGLAARRRPTATAGENHRHAPVVACKNLIEDLLDVARIEAGALVVRPSLEDLVPILEEARDVFRPQAERKGLELLVEAGDGELEARVDRDRIMQALANLLDNAIRLTPEGGRIVLGVEEPGSGAVADRLGQRTGNRPEAARAPLRPLLPIRRRGEGWGGPGARNRRRRGDRASRDGLGGLPGWRGQHLHPSVSEGGPSGGEKDGQAG